MNKILIVEDELAYMKLLQDQLVRQGYTVIQASDGKKGLDLAMSQHPDLILLDVRMPVMDGMKMLEELRKDTYGKTVKVIFLTNLEPNDDTIKNVIDGQPSYYLVKSDIQLSQLLEKVRELLVLQKT
jgi:DNA-binding response OmpR family regulator